LITKSHCEVFYGLAPIAFAGDTPNFQPVKKILFDLGITDASLFHMILSAAADDIAALRGRQISEEAIKHRAIALSMVNKRISQYGLDSSDLNLTTVALLAGWDVSGPHAEKIEARQNYDQGLTIKIAFVWDTPDF